MSNQNFINAVVERLEREKVSPEGVAYMIVKIKQSFRNGVAVGRKYRKQATKEKREAI